MRFTTEILQTGKTTTGIEVPADVVEQLGGGKRPAVVVRFSGYEYRTTVGVMGGKSLLPLSAEHRAKAGVKGGDKVEVELTVDEAPRTTAVPDDFATALAAQPGSREFLDGLTASQQKEWVRWIEEAKKAETREARIAKAVTLLSEGKKTH